MHIHRLSAAKIRNAKPGQLLNDGGGLMLQTTRGKDGRKNQSWLFRYALPEVIVSRHGRPRQRSRDMGLGPIATVSLHEAREKAKLLRQQRLDGIDPIEHRKAQRAEKQIEGRKKAASARTFEQCTFGYISAHGVAWRSQKHAGQWLGTLRKFAFPVVGKMPVSQVDTPLILEILQPIWNEKTETAHRLRGRIEAVLDYATAAKFRSGDNPAVWSNLKHLLAKPEKIKTVRHLDALSYVEIATFMAELRAVDSPAARALEFAILTGTRTAEVLGARWEEEFGKDAETGLDVWTIPPSRTKSGRLHRVPLSDAALAVLERQQTVRGDELVFPGRIDGRGLGHNAMLQVIAALGRKVTAHGFRSTFRDWAAERTSFPRELCEVALGHAVGDETERAYQRGDLLEKRARLMQQWARFCASAPAGQVVPIQAAVS